MHYIRNTENYDLAHITISQHRYHEWSAELSDSAHLQTGTAQAVQHFNEPTNALTLGWYTASAMQNGYHTGDMW